MKLTVLSRRDDDYLCVTGKGRHCFVDLNCGDSFSNLWEIGKTYKLKNDVHVWMDSDSKCLTYLPQRSEWEELPKKAKFKADPVFCVVDLL
jgi:hypothetical protein